MTEHEWQVSQEVGPMLEVLPQEASERKLQLFAVACCRRIWHLLTDEKSRRAVEMAEQFAEGKVDSKALDAACLEAEEVHQEANLDASDPDNPDPAPALLLEVAAAAAEHAATVFDRKGERAEYHRHFADGAATAAVEAVGLAGGDEDAERCAQAEILRDLFGMSPFRALPILDPLVLAFNDGIVKRLAESICEERRFVDLPILADALLDAGCSDAQLLAHLRGAGLHAHGCWAVDAILTK